MKTPTDLPRVFRDTSVRRRVLSEGTRAFDELLSQRTDVFRSLRGAQSNAANIGDAFCERRRRVRLFLIRASDEDDLRRDVSGSGRQVSGRA